ncbi:TonB-dependent receptor [Tunturiibacter empetritectus]|uniref:TonB-dependent transporter Oar-like beta-barrel domain-containing protein n=1 Tax=Tunturiibacter lichenicola TaxID=2051959 RepID=A0A852VBA1_9BACT|nr:carboxypeptidase regulatory-like domain-containing protein [Edaphobacter lichenicola]NYF90173.1 hypothetical protein [Edaphobacter lichenicola]
MKRLLVLVFIITVNVGTAFSQADAGVLSGIVTDTTGAAIAEATVTAVNAGTNAARTVKTAPNGTYQMENLTASVYEVSVTADGFAVLKAEVEVTVGGHAPLDAKLSAVGVTQTVEVESLGGSQVNTDSLEISEIISPQQVSELPSLTRNVYDFVAISGNISNGDAAQGHAENSANLGVGYSINGQRSSGTEILLDGIENTELFGDVVGIQVPIDSIAEVRMTTSNFEPQYGRASGGVVNVVTTSGTNRFHGTLTEFNRLAAYTANSVTGDLSGQPKGGYTRNQFGFFASGPVVKDKLFVAAGTECLRVRSDANVQAYILTPQVQSYLAPTVQSFLTQYGQTFAFANTLTNAQAGAASNPSNSNPSPLFPGVPSSTPALSLVNYNVPQDAGGGVPESSYNVTLRGDYNFSNKTAWFGRYITYRQSQPPGTTAYTPYSNYDVGATQRDYSALAGVTHTFSASLVTNGRVAFSRINLNNNSKPIAVTTPDLFLGASANIGGVNVAFPGTGFSLPYGGPQNAIQWNQDVNWIKKAHSLQFGSQVLYIQENRSFGAYAQATEQLAGSVTGDTTGYPGLFSGVLGTFSTAINPEGAYPGQMITTPATQPNFARSDRFHDWAVYGQDGWRATSKLTVNYGVRYEYFGVQHNNKQNLDSNFYWGLGAGLLQQIRDGTVYMAPQSPIHELWKPSYGTVSPRVGFAFDLLANGRTSVRGGYGVSYERNFGNVTYNVIQNPPNYGVIVQNKVQVTSTNLGALGNSIGPVTLPSTSLRNVSQNIRTPQTQFWSLAVEQQVAQNTIVAVEYLGARGTHLYDIKNINGLGSGNYLLGDPDAGANYAGLTRLNATYSNINNRGSSGDSYYEATNLRFKTVDLHRTGLGMTANYTWGHQIDDLSSTLSETYANGNGFNLGYTNPFDPGYDRGTGDLDVRQRFVIAPIYETPWLKSDRRLAGQVLASWEITGIYTARTGSSFTYYDSTNNDGTFFNVARYVPSTPISRWKYT